MIQPLTVLNSPEHPHQLSNNKNKPNVSEQTHTEFTMKNIIILVSISLIFTSFGCRQQADIPLPPTNYDFIRKTPNLLTARILSVDFQVESDASGVTTSTDSEANFANPGKSKHNVLVKLGSDWTIELKAVDSTKVNFKFCGQKFGSLRVDDQVTIDEEGIIKVNGQTRLPSVPAEQTE